MSEAVMESLCTRCVHCPVCRYKNDYLDIVNAIARLPKRPLEYDFIDGIFVKCKFVKVGTPEVLTRNLTT